MSKYNSFFDNLANVLDKSFSSTKNLRSESNVLYSYKLPISRNILEKYSVKILRSQIGITFK